MDTRIAASLLLCAGLLLTAAGAAEAAELFTPPLNVESGNVIGCLVVNVTPTPKTVTIQIRDINGLAVTPSPDPALFTLEEGEAGFATANVTALSAPTYCRFTVSSKSAVRAAICLLPAVTSTQCLIELPAE